MVSQAPQIYILWGMPSLSPHARSLSIVIMIMF